MANKKPSANTSHAITIETYKSAMMNTSLYQPLCNCGWETPRWFSEEKAKGAGAEHLKVAK